MELDDLPQNGASQAGAFARHLGGEKRVENRPKFVGGDAVFPMTFSIPAAS